ncbi:MAG TPA: threonine ammonia-lyase [Acidimicrobiales bacterium]
MPTLVTVADIEDAAARIRGVIRPTPVDRSDNLSRLCGRPVVLKPEHLQRTGSYKIRGAYNRISRIEPGTRVVAASAGNHAQGVALAARLCGLESLIYMPLNAPIPKVEATRAYGAVVRLDGDTVDECMALARADAAATGAVFVPPFDDPLVVAGQGTVGLEVAREAPEAEVVVVPVGGGGLIAGVATAIAHARPGVRVVGVEAAGAPTLRRALDAGRPVVLESVATMADGTALRSVSDLTLAHAVAYVDDVVTVSEEEISQALLLLLERAKWVVEPSGALGLAALLSGRVTGDGPAVVLCTGGNVDPLLLIKLIEHGLSAAGRYLLLRLVVDDRPGGLAALLTTVAATQANVLEVAHHRAGVALGLDEVEVLLTLETRAPEHQVEVLAALSAAGYRPEPLG